MTLSAGSAPAIPGEGLAVELVPLRDITHLLTRAAHWEVPVVQIGGNLVLFASGGVLLGVRSGWGWGRSALVFAAVGVGIESFQLLLGRAVVVDDVLLAVVGGVLGCAVGRALGRHPGRGAARAGGTATVVPA